jgi:D-beta-D-heptose 7-phosphate kinase/D-beta-D-heptose 1-phosphate adenosyltransferase
MTNSTEYKIQTVKSIVDIVTDSPIIFTNGCFDLLHIGHIKLLEEAANLDGFLIVGINSDKSVRKIKGSNRPIIPEQERARIVAALECVDCVVLFDEATPQKLIELIKPDIIVKGSDWEEGAIVGWEIAKQVVRVSIEPEHSTTAIIESVISKWLRYC